MIISNDLCGYRISHQEQPEFHDSSGQLFSLYSRISEEEENK